MIRAFGNFAGFVAAVVQLTVLTALAATSGVMNQGTAAPALALVSVGLVSIFVFSTVRTLGMAFATCLLRGADAVSWAPPSAFGSFGLWLAYDWSFFSVGGQQSGLRFCGLEIALEGRLA